MIDSMDQNIGRLMKAIRANKGGDNTLVLFLSDNGGCAEEPGGRSPKIVPGPKEFYAARAVLGLGAKLPFRRYKAGRTRAASPRRASPGGRAECRAGASQGGCISSTSCRHFSNWALAVIRRVQGEQNPSGRGQESRERAAWPGASGPQATGGEWSGNRALREGKWKVVWDKATSGGRCLTRRGPDRDYRLGREISRLGQALGCRLGCMGQAQRDEAQGLGRRWGRFKTSVSFVGRRRGSTRFMPRLLRRLAKRWPGGGWAWFTEPVTSA